MIDGCIQPQTALYLALEESLRQTWRDSESYGAQTGVTYVSPDRTIPGHRFMDFS